MVLQGQVLTTRAVRGMPSLSRSSGSSMPSFTASSRFASAIIGKGSFSSGCPPLYALMSCRDKTISMLMLSVVGSTTGDRGQAGRPPCRLYMYGASFCRGAMQKHVQQLLCRSLGQHNQGLMAFHEVSLLSETRFQETNKKPVCQARLCLVLGDELLGCLRAHPVTHLWNCPWTSCFAQAVGTEI